MFIRINGGSTSKSVASLPVEAQRRDPVTYADEARLATQTGIHLLITAFPSLLGDNKPPVDCCWAFTDWLTMSKTNRSNMSARGKEKVSE